MGLFLFFVNHRLPLANIPSLFASDNTGVYTDYRLTYLIGTTNETQSKYYTLKYNPSVESVVEAMENPMIPVIRFSEICHILAEISSYNGKITEGINYLETVRKARGAERTLSLTVSTREQLDAEILLDIRKEMIGERWNLLHLQTDEPLHRARFRLRKEKST